MSAYERGRAKDLNPVQWLNAVQSSASKWYASQYPSAQLHVRSHAIFFRGQLRMHLFCNCMVTKPSVRLIIKTSG